MHSGDRIEFSCYSGTTVARGGGSSNGPDAYRYSRFRMVATVLYCSSVGVFVCLFTPHTRYSLHLSTRGFLTISILDL
jgi:hypothetical protein